MKKWILLLVIIFIACGNPNEQGKLDPKAPDFAEKAAAVHNAAIVIDTHIDIPYRITHENVNGSERLADGHFDFVRAKEGGLDAPFFAVYVASKFNKPGTDPAAEGGAYAEAMRVVAQVDSVVKANADVAALATSPDEIEKIVAAGKIAVCKGMENGAPIEGDFEKLHTLYKNGIRYITLTHSKDNHICDSSYDERHTNKGLTEFGKKLIPELNRIGMMIDISHVSDDAFWQTIELSKAPLIASHSGLRTFRHMERNMSDSMLVALAKKGGVLQYCFGSFFITDEVGVPAQKRFEFKDSVDTKYKNDPKKAAALYEHYLEEHPAPNTNVDEVARQIDYAVKLVGIDHLGIGSDYDGVGAVPEGLEDVSKYPNLTRKLLAMGYTQADIRKITGGNLLRVWREVEAYSAQQSASH